MLRVENLQCGYGDIIAARDVSLAVGAGQVVALLGANGAGKTSILLAIMGLVERKSGKVIVDGVDISQLAPSRRIHAGIAISPEGRRVFADLTVEENLITGGYSLARKQVRPGIARVFDLFPRLGERHLQLAGSLSGGEQQMLAIGRALISKPKVLMIDELSLGLMPTVVEECYRVIDQLRNEGVGILVVDQNTQRVIDAADDVYVLEAGNLVWSGAANDENLSELLTRHLLGKSAPVE